MVSTDRVEIPLCMSIYLTKRKRKVKKQKKKNMLTIIIRNLFAYQIGNFKKGWIFAEEYILFGLSKLWVYSLLSLDSKWSGITENHLFYTPGIFELLHLILVPLLIYFIMLKKIYKLMMQFKFFLSTSNGYLAKWCSPSYLVHIPLWGCEFDSPHLQIRIKIKYDF